MNNINDKKKYIILGGIIVSLIMLMALCLTLIPPRYYYGQGIEKFDAGEYSQAIELFKSAKGYQDSAEKITLSTKALHYTDGVTALSNSDYPKAIGSFKSAEDYLDATEQLALSNKALHYADGVAALSNNDYSEAVDNFIKAVDYLDAQQKLQDAANRAFDIQAWDTAILAFDVLPTPETNDYRFYALGMQAMGNKDFMEALTCFERVKTVDGVTDKIAEANYNQGIDDFNSAKYESALNYLKQANTYENVAELIIECSYEAGKIEFDRGNYESSLNYFNASSGYSDTADWVNNVSFMIAEKKYMSANYNEAMELYKALPNGFSFNGVNVADRLNALALYDYFIKYEGTYNCTYGYIEVRQTSKSYGSWNNWYNDDKDGKLTISVKLNSDGTVTLEGEAKGYRYTSFSIISSGIRSTSISAKFNVKLSSKSLPQTLYNENNMTIKSTGGTNFTFSYYCLDKNEDIYFNYKYASDYKFGK